MVTFALLAAICFGTSDFLGGLASRKSSSLLVVLCFQLVGILLFGGALLLVLEPLDGHALLWGIAAGIAYGLGFACYYRGFVVSSMGIVAIFTAVWAAVVPVAFGLLLGDRPSPTAILGVVIALVAIGLTANGHNSSQPQPKPQELFKTPGFLEGTLAGLCFGIFFICLSFPGASSTLWPLLSSTFAALITTLLIAMLSEGNTFKLATLAQTNWLMVMLAGLLQSGGTLAFLFALRSGLLSLSAVLVGLSPVPTVLLARWLLLEKMHRLQWLGIGLGLLGIILISAES